MCESNANVSIITLFSIFLHLYYSYKIKLTDLTHSSTVIISVSLTVIIVLSTWIVITILHKRAELTERQDVRGGPGRRLDEEEGGGQTGPGQSDEEATGEQSGRQDDPEPEPETAGAQPVGPEPEAAGAQPIATERNCFRGNVINIIS